MKVLADTSVWSLSLRRKNAAKLSVEERRLTALLSEAISDGRVVMIGRSDKNCYPASKIKRSSTSSKTLYRSFGMNRLTPSITKKPHAYTTYAGVKA